MNGAMMTLPRRIVDKISAESLSTYDLVHAWPNLERLLHIERGYWCDSLGNVVVGYLSDTLLDLRGALKQRDYQGPGDWEPCRIVMCAGDNGDDYMLLITNPDYVALSDDECPDVLAAIECEEIESFEKQVVIVYTALMNYRWERK